MTERRIHIPDPARQPSSKAVRVSFPERKEVRHVVHGPDINVS